jgi:PhzF family phenazine biosynthesis protein
MQIKLYQLDAFTNQLFKGNPAAVCPLESWLDDKLLQSIAAENSLSETVYIVPRHNDYHIRWFTPVCEVDLCGHGSLAASHVVMNILEPDREYLTFYSASGPLHVEKKDGGFVMDFPASNFEACEVSELIKQALGMEPLEFYCNEKYMAVLESEAQVRALQPDMNLLMQLELNSLVVTAQGEHVDFVSRFFAPKEGIDEDPVTGSAHCLLAPYWSEKLGKAKLKAHQLSKRGGELLCEVKGDRVILAGKVKLYMSGSIELN